MPEFKPEKQKFNNYEILVISTFGKEMGKVGLCFYLLSIISKQNDTTRIFSPIFTLLQMFINTENYHQGFRKLTSENSLKNTLSFV